MYWLRSSALIWSSLQPHEPSDNFQFNCYLRVHVVQEIPICSSALPLFVISWSIVEWFGLVHPQQKWKSLKPFSDMTFWAYLEKWVWTFSSVCRLHMNSTTGDSPLRHLPWGVVHKRQGVMLWRSHVFVYSTSTPASALIAKSSLDIFVSFTCMALPLHP